MNLSVISSRSDLSPGDSAEEPKPLELMQEYFLVNGITIDRRIPTPSPGRYQIDEIVYLYPIIAGQFNRDTVS